MNQVEPASFEEFKLSAADRGVVPVVRRVAADLQTPVGAFLRLRERSRYAFLLESVQGGEALARYTFLGAGPHTIVRGQGSNTLVEKDKTRTMLEGTSVIDYLRAHFNNHRLAARENLPPLAGGCIGYLAYEAARLFEPTLGIHEARDTDDAVLMFFSTILAFDHVKQQIEITNLVFTDKAQNEVELRALYENALATTADTVRTLDEPLPTTDHVPSEYARSLSPPEFTADWEREEYERAVEQVREHIQRGDCYQVVLSRRISASVVASPFEIYRALRRTNPAPYMYFLQLDDTAIIGASPEMLVRARDGELTYRPIAGTRPRGASASEDERLADELRRDAKEIAEHSMLVDLGRNDLGRVAEYGTIKVAKLMTIERYAHVQHLVTELRAQLRDDCDHFDALAACFPAGTVTGAPKLRAMEIIRELEPGARGVYAGAILYADYAGNLDSCIAIRTIIAREGKAHIQAGAGIVFDSVAANEYEETINKAKALVRALEIAEKQWAAGNG